MRKPITVLLSTFMLLAVFARPSFSAVEIPYKKPPFNVLTWPVQVLWQIVMAPVEAFKGGQETVHAYFPDAKMPQVKMPSWKMPFFGSKEAAPAKAATDSAVPPAPKKSPKASANGSANVPASVATSTGPQH